MVGSDLEGGWRIHMCEVGQSPRSPHWKMWATSTAADRVTATKAPRQEHACWLRDGQVAALATTAGKKNSSQGWAWTLEPAQGHSPLRACKFLDSSGFPVLWLGFDFCQKSNIFSFLKPLFGEPTPQWFTDLLTHHSACALPHITHTVITQIVTLPLAGVLDCVSSDWSVNESVPTGPNVWTLRSRRRNS